MAMSIDNQGLGLDVLLIDRWILSIYESYLFSIELIIIYLLSYDAISCTSGVCTKIRIY